MFSGIVNFQRVLYISKTKRWDSQQTNRSCCGGVAENLLSRLALGDKWKPAAPLIRPEVEGGEQVSSGKSSANTR